MYLLYDEEGVKEPGIAGKSTPLANGNLRMPRMNRLVSEVVADVKEKVENEDSFIIGISDDVNNRSSDYNANDGFEMIITENVAKSILVRSRDMPDMNVNDFRLFHFRLVSLWLSCSILHFDPFHQFICFVNHNFWQQQH